MDPTYTVTNVVQPFSETRYLSWRDAKPILAAITVAEGGRLKANGSNFNDAHQTPLMEVTASFLEPGQGNLQQVLQYAKKASDAVPKYRIVCRAISESDANTLPDPIFAAAVEPSKEYDQFRRNLDQELAAMAGGLENINPGVNDNGEMAFWSYVDYAYEDKKTGEMMRRPKGATITTEDGETHYGIYAVDVFHKEDGTFEQVPIWPGDIQAGDIVSVVTDYHSYSVGKKLGVRTGLTKVQRWGRWSERVTKMSMSAITPF